ncbi:hypothetical protein [Methanobrevibacter sp.]
MKINRTIILAIIVVIIAILAIFISGSGQTNNDTATTTPFQSVSDLEKHDFDSYFTMNIPKNTIFEKSNGTTRGDISLYINYKDTSEKINVIYAEAVGGKANLEQTYKDMAQDNANTTIKTINNVTIVHFNDENIIGENDYHDLAIAGDDSKYVLLQCNNETLMNSMAESLKFN